MIVVEAVDELLAVDVPDVLRSCVPQRHMGVDDEVALAVLAVHVRLRSSVTAVTPFGQRKVGEENRTPDPAGCLNLRRRTIPVDRPRR